MRKGIGTIQGPKYPKGMSAEQAEEVKRDFIADSTRIQAANAERREALERVIDNAKSTLAHFGLTAEILDWQSVYVYGPYDRVPASVVNASIASKRLGLENEAFKGYWERCRGTWIMRFTSVPFAEFVDRLQKHIVSQH